MPCVCMYVCMVWHARPASYLLQLARFYNPDILAYCIWVGTLYLLPTEACLMPHPYIYCKWYDPGMTYTPSLLST